MPSRFIHYLTIGVTALTLFLSIISTATNYWLEYDENEPSLPPKKSTKVNYGIWRETNSDKDKAIQAFTVMAVLAFGASLAAISLALKKSIFLKIYFLTMAGAAILQLIPMAIFTQEHKSPIEGVRNFGWSFVLGWIAFVLALFSIASAYLMRNDGVEN